MNALKKFLNVKSKVRPTAQTPGKESNWLEFCELTFRGKQALVCDRGFFPSKDDGVLIKIIPGKYVVEGKVMVYASDRRVSRLRVILPGKAPQLGPKLGETWTDTAATGVGDYATVRKTCEALGETKMEELLDEAWDAGRCGVLELDKRAGVGVPFVDSGFGDGTFPIFELKRNGQRVGFEIEFIRPGQPYPFDEESDAEATDQGEVKEDLLGQALKEIVSELKATKKTGDKAKDRAKGEEVFSNYLKKMEAKAQEQSEEWRRIIVDLRRKGPPLEFELVASTEPPIANPAALEERLSFLKQAGFAPAGRYQIKPLKKAFVTAFAHPKKRIWGLVNEVEMQAPDVVIELVFLAHDDNGNSYGITDTSEAPGFPGPPWRTWKNQPGKSPAQLLTAFQKMIKGRMPKPAAPEDFVTVYLDGFKRLQTWRADRGGWTITELKAQRPGQTFDADEWSHLCYESRETWLYSWLKLQSDLPFDPLACVEKLIIIHDELPPDLISSNWQVGTKEYRARASWFEQGTPREAFARMNQDKGHPLQLVYQKVSGLAADYYLMP